MLKGAAAFSGFAVDDVPRAKEFYGSTLGLEVVDELTARGVRFEHDGTGPKTDAKGIHRTPEVHPVAWFRDPAGNILSIIQE
jgi:catechol 2,3-dioxygenase-like lactoylglutathione lyase family enzyme